MRKIEKVIEAIMKNAEKNGRKTFWFKDGEYVYVTDGMQVIQTNEIDGVNASELSGPVKKSILDKFRDIPADRFSSTYALDRWPKHSELKAKMKELKAAYKERTGAKRNSILIGYRTEEFTVNVEYLLNALSIVDLEYCVSGYRHSDPVLLLSKYDDTNYLIMQRYDAVNDCGMYAGERIPDQPLLNIMTEHDLLDKTRAILECA